MVFCRKPPNEGRPWIPLHIFNKENGEIVMEKHMDIMVRRTRIQSRTFLSRIESITLCRDKVIIQTIRPDGGLRIVDLNTDDFVELHDTKIFIENSPIYLPHRHCFLGELPIILDDYEDLKIGIWDLHNKFLGTPTHKGSPDWLIHIPFFIVTPPPRHSTIEQMTIVEDGNTLLVCHNWPMKGKLLGSVNRVPAIITYKLNAIFCTWLNLFDGVCRLSGRYCGFDFRRRVRDSWSWSVFVFVK